MEFEVLESNKGYEIKVFTDKKAAVVVYGEEERIYLPEKGSNNTNYYSETTGELIETNYGYRVIHSGKIKELEVLG